MTENGIAKQSSTILTKFLFLFFFSLQLENTPHANYLNTLNLFAYGTYKQYLENQSSLIELSDVMKQKLKHLTIVTMAISNKCIAYSDLLEQLDIGCVRDLEDLIIESIYAGLWLQLQLINCNFNKKTKID